MTQQKIALREHPLEPVFYLNISAYGFPNHVIINSISQTEGFKFLEQTDFLQSYRKGRLPCACKKGDRGPLLEPSSIEIVTLQRSHCYRLSAPILSRQTTSLISNALGPWPLNCYTELLRPLQCRFLLPLRFQGPSEPFVSEGFSFLGIHIYTETCVCVCLHTCIHIYSHIYINRKITMKIHP